MNSAVRTPAKEVGAQGSEGWSRLRDWRRLLGQCGRKPTQKRVHALRVATLRVLADLEHRIAKGRMAPEGAKAAGRWCKHASKLRRVLSSVRAADVWLAKLDGLRRLLRAAGGPYVPRSNRECLRQIDDVEEWLQQKRQAWKRVLVAEIEVRRDRLEQRSREVELAAEHSDSHTKNGGSKQIREQFAAVAAVFRALDVSNLHEFRKRIKKVRYLAEIFGATEPEAARQASVLKRMQSTIGEWHDWQELAAEARRHDNKHAELAELLETLAAESFEKAVDLCHRSTERLLNHGEHAGEVEQPVPKKPPARSAVATAAYESGRHA